MRTFGNLEHDPGGNPGGRPARTPSGNFPLARLLQVIVLLQSGSCPNARHLAEQCEVSRRTIYRDLATLSAAGLLVRYRPDRQGYQLVRDVFLHPPRLELDEALALLVISRHWEVADDLGLLNRARCGVDKIIQSLPEEMRNRLMMMRDVLREPPHPGEIPPDRQQLYMALFTAAGQRRQVRIWLRDSEDVSQATTKLGIYRFTPIRGSWSVVGRSTLHRDVCAFPIKGIERAEPTTDPYSIPPRFNLKRFLLRDGAPVEIPPRHVVWLRCRSGGLPQMSNVRLLAEPEVVRGRDMDADIILRVDSLSELLPALFEQGDDIEVIAPDELRSAICELAQRVAARHTGRHLQTVASTRMPLGEPIDHVGG